MARASKKAGKSAKSTEAQLERYRSMRDFSVTQEPSGAETPSEAAAAANALPFVIQKHAATRLHYDFRLGWNGVLKSWAVAKGPSYFPGDKRLAVQVEDHPMEYGGFEGIIPKGQYGGGTVMLWDRGTWEPHVDVDEGLAKGSLKFAMHGEKMKGNWALVRMGGHAANESKPNWLLIKEHDAEERGEGDTPIVEEAPDSVLSGRNLDAIARAEDRVWDSHHGERTAAQTSAISPQKPENKTDQKTLAKASSETLPSFVNPQLATLAKAPPTGERWIHELKLDGYRMQARIDAKAKSVQLLTRNGLDWTARMRPVADALSAISVQSALIDGEVVVLNEDGTSSFAALQASFQEGSRNQLYFVFDLLHLNGKNLRGLPLSERKKLLAALIPDDHPTIRLSEHIAGDANEIFREACRLGSEGIVSKLSDAPYAEGRSSNWLKAKCYLEQEFVIGGFTLPSNETYGVGALLLGYYRGGKLIYAGRTGTGFTQKTHKSIRDRLEAVKSTKSPFEAVPPAQRRGVLWVKPELVAQISFSTWTADNLVRQASFKGLREDKPARSVTREEAKPAGSAAAAPRAEKPAAATHSTRPARSASRGTAPNRKSADLPVRLTHPDKVLDAASGVTKADLAHFYQAIAPFILPYIEGRPLTLVRCVDGSGKPCFYQKHKNEMLSASFDTVQVVDKKSGKPEPYITVSTETAIIELAQIAVLEVHPWGSRNVSLETPDRLIFDLDPDEAIRWDVLADSAKEVRERLSKLGLKSFVKSTGGKGLHVVAPIRPEHPWPSIKQFAHEFVLAMEKSAPRLFLTKMTKAARVGKIYLDYLRNERGATAVAPFSPRARAGLPVAVTLSWNELKESRPPRYTVAEFSEWKSRLRRDPWKAMQALDQRLHLDK